MIDEGNRQNKQFQRMTNTRMHFLLVQKASLNAIRSTHPTTHLSEPLPVVVETNQATDSLVVAVAVALSR